MVRTVGGDVAIATPRDRLGSQQRSELVRTWTRSAAASGSLAVMDPQLDDADALVAQLKTAGICTEIHRDHMRALVRLGVRRPDVVIVSAAMCPPLLPPLISVLRSELRVPVLLSFSADEIETIGPAVAAGALPLVGKPYELANLLTALQSHWPRRDDRGGSLTVGDLALDVDGYDARLGPKRIDFTPGEFDVLVILAHHPDHVVMRDKLARLWPASPDPDAALVATVAKIRRKLASAGAATAIQTVRGLGYRIETAGLRARPAEALTD